MAQLSWVVIEGPTRNPAQRGLLVEAKCWVVEKTLARRDRYRRILKDYERTVEHFAAFELMTNVQAVLLAIPNEWL